MKKFAFGVFGFVALGLAVPAAAADLPRMYSKAPALVPAVYDWSGIYVGVNGGLGTSRNCWDFTDPAGNFIVAEGCHNATGGVLGGQVGYRAQLQSWVFGIEAQGDWANLHGSNVSAAFPAFVNESRINSLGMLTGQIGYALNNILLYAKGGAAMTKAHYDTTTTAGVLAATTPDETRWGGVAGGGIEWGFAPNWSVAVEYDHLFMPDKLASFTDTFGFFFGTDRIHQNVDLATLRLNFHWPVH